MGVTAKFVVNEIKLTAGSRVVLGDDGKPKKDARGYDVYEPCEMRSIKMSPVYGNGDPHHENTKFWQSSPSGEFRIDVVNPAASEQFKVGQEWLFDMTLAKDVTIAR